jgi:hypothetical protein
MARSLPPRLHTRAEFIRRATFFILFAVVCLAVSLGIGTVGYWYFAQLGWIESFLNASMILTGMGPVDPMQTDGAKLFASFYAIFSGAIYPTLAAVALYPFVHRMMKVLHAEGLTDDDDQDDKP